MYAGRPRVAPRGPACMVTPPYYAKPATLNPLGKDDTQHMTVLTYTGDRDPYYVHILVSHTSVQS